MTSAVFVLALWAPAAAEVIVVLSDTVQQSTGPVSAPAPSPARVEPPSPKTSTQGAMAPISAPGSAALVLLDDECKKEMVLSSVSPSLSVLQSQLVSTFFAREPKNRPQSFGHPLIHLVNGSGDAKGQTRPPSTEGSPSAVRLEELHYKARSVAGAHWADEIIFEEFEEYRLPPFIDDVFRSRLDSYLNDKGPQLTETEREVFVEAYWQRTEEKKDKVGMTRIDPSNIRGEQTAPVTPISGKTAVPGPGTLQLTDEKGTSFFIDVDREGNYSRAVPARGFTPAKMTLRTEDVKAAWELKDGTWTQTIGITKTRSSTPSRAPNPSTPGAMRPRTSGGALTDNVAFNFSGQFANLADSDDQAMIAISEEFRPVDFSASLSTNWSIGATYMKDWNSPVVAATPDKSTGRFSNRFEIDTAAGDTIAYFSPKLNFQLGARYDSFEVYPSGSQGGFTMCRRSKQDLWSFSPSYSYNMTENLISVDFGTGGPIASTDDWVDKWSDGKELTGQQRQIPGNATWSYWIAPTGIAAGAGFSQWRTTMSNRAGFAQVDGWEWHENTEIRWAAPAPSLDPSHWPVTNPKGLPHAEIRREIP